MGEGREDDTTGKRWKGERECRFCLKVTVRGIGGTQVVKSSQVKSPLFI